MSYESSASPNGVERLSTDTDQVFVPFSGDHTIMLWYRWLSPAQDVGDFPTIFYIGDNPQTLYADVVWLGLNGKLPPDGPQVSLFMPGLASPQLYIVEGGMEIWHHFAYVRSGTSHLLYVDGALRITETAVDLSALPAPTHMYLGTHTIPSDWNDHSVGKMREWDVALTAEEIAEEIQNDEAVKTANLVTEAPFEGDFHDRYQVAAGSLALAGEIPLLVIA